MNALDSFIDEVNEHIFERRCRARVCKGLIRYEADRDAARRPEHAERWRDGAMPQRGAWAATGRASTASLPRALPDAVRVVDASSGIGPAPELISVQPAQRIQSGGPPAMACARRSPYAFDSGDKRRACRALLFESLPRGASRPGT